MKENTFLTQDKAKSIPFIFLLTVVWLILLALCAMIGIFIVPLSLNTSNYFVIGLIAFLKIAFAGIFIAIWLFGWYKSLTYLLYIQFYMAEFNASPTDD